MREHTVAGAGDRGGICAAVVMRGCAERGEEGRLVLLSEVLQSSGVRSAMLVGRCGVSVYEAPEPLILYSN